MGSLLLVEDDDPKREQLLSFLRSEYSLVEVSVAKSLNAACKLIDNNDFDVILLDMSLPTFDGGKTVGASGRQRTLGGRDLLRYIVECEVSSPVYVVTGFKDFPDEVKKIQLDELDKELRKEFPENYFGKIFFSHSSDDWKLKIGEILGDIAC